MIVYLIQSHKDPNQIERLVRKIAKTTEGYIILHHDSTGEPLPKKFLSDLDNVSIIYRPGSRSRGTFEIIEEYMKVVIWLNQNVDYKWLINISGEDYPAQSIQKTEQELDNTTYQAFIQYYDIFTPESPWSVMEGRNRYFYQYHQLKTTLTKSQKALLKIPKEIINNSQDLIKINTSAGLFVGTKVRNHPFINGYRCYCGSFFQTLSRECVEYVYHDYMHNLDLVNYYHKVYISDESYFQTVLINYGKFNIANNSRRYIDFTNSIHGHPRYLSVEDCKNFLGKEYFFARKFLANHPALDYLDSQITD